MSLTSAQPKSEPSAAPENDIPGARPLRNYMHERYAHARVLGYGIVAAARLIGWSPTSGAASKAEVEEDVQARMTFLAQSNVDRTREKRLESERRLNIRASANILDFCRIKRGKLVPDLSNIAKLPEEYQRELLASVSYDAKTRNLRFDPKICLEAEAQLRKLNGLDAPEKLSLTDPTGVRELRVEFVPSRSD